MTVYPVEGSLTHSASGPHGEDETLVSYVPVLRAALLISVGLLLTLAGWGMFARLDAALVINGVLHADSDRKTVEHLEGGILAEFLVKRGDKVEAGQPVARLDDTQMRERMVQLESDHRTRKFALWRLEAEKDGHIPLLQDAAGQDLGITPAQRAVLLQTEIALFEARMQTHDAQIDALQRQIAQRRGQIGANEGQARAAETQLDLWREERETAAKLVRTGTFPRQRLLEIDRVIAGLGGDSDENRGLAAAGTADIARAEAEMRALVQGRLAEITAELGATRSELAAIESQIRAAQDVSDRLVLRAPQTGRVVDLSTVTIGAVLGAGQPLMEILPSNDLLVALIRLEPSAIDSVGIGSPAKVRLIAYRRADAPLLEGQVSYVSADLLEDPLTGTAYFEARVALNRDSVAALETEQVLAGMPVEVTLIIGERRAGDYLLEPVLRHLRRAFLEE